MSQRSKFSEFFGSFAEGSFYTDLAKTVITEVLRAAVLALTGSISMYIVNKVNGGKMLPPSTAPASSNSDLGNRAFGGSEYSSYSGRNYTAQNQPATSHFPGFGGR